MGRMLSMLFVAGLAVLAFAFQANAGTMAYTGTLGITIGQLDPQAVAGTGIATYNGGVGGTHVTDLTWIASDIKGKDIVNVTDPESDFSSIRLTATMGAGALKGMLGGGSANTVLALTANTAGVVGGQARLCLIFGCGFALDIPLAVGTNQAGIGGQATVVGTGPVAGLSISVTYRQWTILTGTVIDHLDNTTKGTVTFSGMAQAGAGVTGTGKYTLKKTTGIVHGPASSPSTVALATTSPAGRGVIQFVSPTQATTNITNTSSLRTSVPTRLRFQFVPEPGMMLLIVSGVAGLAVLGRRRMKK